MPFKSDDPKAIVRSDWVVTETSVKWPAVRDRHIYRRILLEFILLPPVITIPKVNVMLQTEGICNSRFAGATDEDVEWETRKWLHNALDRAGGQKLRIKASCSTVFVMHLSVRRVYVFVNFLVFTRIYIYIIEEPFSDFYAAYPLPPYNWDVDGMGQKLRTIVTCRLKWRASLS
ncbi:hypothetical protein AHF37_11228 [Paragonimus kellicotti]|nr:hypothetical protein AHF37_11228 [Paragonimus kellicotti]